MTARFASTAGESGRSVLRLRCETGSPAPPGPARKSEAQPEPQTGSGCHVRKVEYDIYLKFPFFFKWRLYEESDSDVLAYVGK